MKLYRYLMIFLVGYSTMLWSTRTQEEIIESFLKPVKCTQTGLRCFLRHMLNKRLYTEIFLPRTFMHMIDLLEFGRTIEQPRSYFYSVISLFHERFQESHFVNPYALHELLQAWADLIPYQLFAHEQQILQKNIANHLKKSLKERFTEFKQNPYTFLDTLSNEIYALIQENDDIPASQLHLGCVRFLDQLCNKVIWDPRENYETWLSCRQLFEDLNVLYDFGFIPDEQILNQLVWALVYRYSYFINSAGAELTLDCYASIKDDLAKNTPQLLLLPEQEEVLTTKVQKLQHMVMAGEVKARAKLQGIVTDTLRV